jgi:hypothetical protein
VVCNRATSDRRGGLALKSLGIPEYSWEIDGIDYVTDLPKLGSYGNTAVIIMVCHLAKMARFVPCHKEIMIEESTDLFISIFCKLHGVPKIKVSDRDPKLMECFGKVL